MGVSRRSLVFRKFGNGKRLPNEDDCAENALRIVNPGRLSDSSPTLSPPRGANNVSESGGEEDPKYNNNLEPTEANPNDTLSADAKKSSVKRKAGTFWNNDEAMVFYDGLKEHGKSFELIASTLNKKKISKDKDQTRNFFYNTFKIMKDKAAINDQEWSHVPQTAKELLIVINALEWRKRTHSANVNVVKFKNLIMTGTTNVKVQGKRVPILVRTPNCPALHKFFPSLKQLARIPNTMTIQLVPNSYASRRYVLSCGQNPLLTVAVNTQSPVSTLFRFLEYKWQRFSNRGPDFGDQQPPTVVLYPPEGFKPSKVLIQPADDAHPSVKSMRIGDSRISSNIASTSKAESVVGPRTISNTFEILEEQLTKGLMFESALNTSFLHFYYLFNQQSTICLHYDLITNVRSTNVFIKLSELIRNSEGIIDGVKMKKRSSTTTPQPVSTVNNSTTSKRLPNFRMAAGNEDAGTSVVDGERAQFEQQLAGFRQKSNDSKKIGRMDNKRAHGGKPSPKPNMQNSNSEETIDSFGFPCYRQKTAARRETTSQQSVRYSQPISASQEQMMFEDVANNETRSSLISSPSKLQDAKSLQEDVYRYFESMASQNSNDVFSNFSQLINSVGAASESSQSALE